MCDTMCIGFTYRGSPTRQDRVWNVVYIKQAEDEMKIRSKAERRREKRWDVNSIKHQKLAKHHRDYGVRPRGC